MEYESLFKAARQAGTLLAETETERLGRTLMHAAQLLRTHTPRLLEANARGPMGLPELSTYKYVVTGDGQIRES